MPITGVAVQTIPAETEKVYKILEEMTEVSLYGNDGKGNIIAVLDTKSKNDLDELSQKIESLEGVIKVLGVYHHFEDDLAETEERAK